MNTPQDDPGDSPRICDEELAAYAAGELDDDERAELRMRVPDIDERVAELERVDAYFEKTAPLPPPGGMPAPVWSRLRDRLRELHPQDTGDVARDEDGGDPGS